MTVDESKLVFIVSQPRSGSTLLQKLISNNSYTDTVSEPWLLLPLLSIYKPSLITAAYNYPVALQGFFDYLEKKNAGPAFRDAMKKLVLDMYQVSDASRFFIDKTPRYYEILPEIAALFPRARFLVLKRNLFGSLHSMVTTWAGGQADYDKFATFFRDFLVAPFRIQEFVEEQAGNPNVRAVKYEDIVAAPETNIRSIYEWLGIPFDNSVLEIGNNDKVKGIFGDDVYKKSPLTQVTPGLSDSWRESLSDKNMVRLYAGYQDYLGTGFIRSYGYQEESFSIPFAIGKDKFSAYIDELKRKKAI